MKTSTTMSSTMSTEDDDYIHLITLEDIDSLLCGSSDYPPSLTSSRFNSLSDFEEYLVQRKPAEEAYGMFTKNTAMLNFKNDPDGEKILEQIKAKNKKLGIGNINIPGTNIHLINFSYCPQCKKVFSFKELLKYFERPKPVDGLSYTQVLRKDTRVFCDTCHTSFLPSLVIDDGTPREEMQFLCRAQTIDAVESHCRSALDKEVLTRKRGNIMMDSATQQRRLINDVDINDLISRPTLIANIIQYSDPDLALRFILGNNMAEGDVLYGQPYGGSHD